MQATSAEIEEILERLAEAPRRIAAMTSSLNNARLHAKIGEDPWSANDILAHLRSCADVWGKSILAMLAQDHPTLRYVSPRTWINKTNYLEQDFHLSFQAFARQRDDLLAALKPLAIEGWSRAATFTGTTRGRDQTVFTYARRIVDHEQAHLDQLEGVLNSLAQQG
jgi:uncharacterized damage-inducible protein DinB